MSWENGVWGPFSGMGGVLRRQQSHRVGCGVSPAPVVVPGQKPGRAVGGPVHGGKFPRSLQRLQVGSCPEA